MSTKLRRTKRSDGKEGKAVKRLNGRIEDWKNTTGKNSDNLKAYKKPGRGF